MKTIGKIQKLPLQSILTKTNFPIKKILYLKSWLQRKKYSIVKLIDSSLGPKFKIKYILN